MPEVIACLDSLEGTDIIWCSCQVIMDPEIQMILLICQCFFPTYVLQEVDPANFLLSARFSSLHAVGKSLRECAAIAAGDPESIAFETWWPWWQVAARRIGISTSLLFKGDPPRDEKSGFHGLNSPWKDGDCVLPKLVCVYYIFTNGESDDKQGIWKGNFSLVGQRPSEKLPEICWNHPVIWGNLGEGQRHYVFLVGVGASKGSFANQPKFWCFPMFIELAMQPTGW